MAQINCTVERRYLRMEQTVDVTTGSIGSIQCSFSFDGEWEGLQKTAIFKAADNQTYPVLLANDSCTVPNEAICDGHYLTMGVMGTRDGTVVIATEWQNGDLNTGCYTAIAPPSEDIYLQILNEFSTSTARVEAAADKVQASADDIKASLPAIHQDAETAKAKAAEAATAAGEAAQSRDKAKEYQDAAQASASDALASAQAAAESEENTAAMQSEVQRLAGQVSADKADVTSKAQTVALQAQQVQETADGFQKDADAAKEAVTAEGTKQVGLVAVEGTKQVKAVADKGTEQIAAVNEAGAIQTANAQAEADRAQQQADRAQQEANRAAAIDAYTKEETDYKMDVIKAMMVPMLIKSYGTKEAMRRFVSAYADGVKDLSPIVGQFFQLAANAAEETYTTQFHQYSANTSTEGTKLDDNAGLVCTPSTIASAGQDDYADLPLFACFDCNYTIDAKTLEPVIHAIKDVYGEFTATPADSLVGVIQMTGYVRRTSDASTKTVAYRAQPAKGFNPLPEAVSASDNTVRSFVVHAKYAAGYNSAGLLSSVSGVQPATMRPGSEGSTSISFNGQIAKWREWGNQYCGSSLCDIAFIQLMLEIKYAVLGSAQVMTGCRSYSTTYTAAAAETGVTRVLLTPTQGSYFVVGSCVSLGSTNDRAKATTYDVCDITKILSMEDVTVDGTAYKAVNLDTETPFNTTTATYIVTHPWQTGSTDEVPGNDGSPTNNTSGKEPCKIQGIEVMVGAYEVPGDTTLYEDAEKYTVYLNRKASDIAENGNGANSVTIGTIPKETDAAWKYIAELNWDANNQEAYMLAQTFADSSTAGYRAGVYRDGAVTTSWRVWPAFGHLDVWGYCGFACVLLNSGLSAANWGLAARACGSGGNRGEYKLKE